MRRETGEELLASSPHLRPGGPPLSLLAGRIAQTRGRTATGTPGPPPPAPVPLPATQLSLTPPSADRLRREAAPALSLPAPGLVSAPPAGRTLGSCTHPVGTVALLGAHGGAGVTSLLRAGLDQVAVDAHRCWPRAGLVLLVARTSISGLEWARDLARQHASGRAGDVELLGLVLVPDAPGRLPPRTGELRDLVSGAFGRTWQLPWLEPWRLAATTEPLPAHPAVQQLLAELARTRPLPPRHLSHPDLSQATRAPGELL
jgi:hypothetical protein